ncbi:hypothetical protein DL98DRAFT_178596 [Cadophora sp. DSE1049]|nr:hypothetical protein DL98DRAFT_178596 [Cadophora sp. DSE1049]
MITEQSFPLFPLFPPELRLAIFSHALSNLPPRTLFITQISGPWATSSSLPVFTPSVPIASASTSHSRFIYTDGTERYTTRCSPSVVPALLHVNREARELTLERYSLITLDDAEGVEKFFDFERAMLVLKCHPAWGSPSETPNPSTHQRTPRDQLARVRNLTILGFRHRNYAFATLSLTPFFGLQKLVLVGLFDGRKGERIERVGRKAVEGFWRERMNVRQREEGADATDPPKIGFLSLDEVLAIEERCEGSS